VSAAVLERAGERGLEVATLQAGPVSAPLFQRMGFTTVSTYRLFQLPEGPHA
jgi:hypothetical protein